MIAEREVTTAPAPPPVAADATINQAGEVRSRRVESLRALAALGVLVGHTFALAHSAEPSRSDTFLDRLIVGGGYGVFLFFALSGYLLFWPFARREFGGGEKVDLRRYATNRALRILPLYYVVIVTILLLQESGGTFDQWWRFLLFAENFSHETVTTVNGVVWSLVVELHFYALLPFFAVALGRITRGSLERALLVLVALAAASVLLRYVTQTPDPPPSLWRYSLPATFFFFIAGMLVALLRLAWQEHRPRWLTGALASSTTWLLASVPLWLVVPWRLGFEADVTSAVASLLIVGACVLPLRPGPLVRGLEWRPLAVVGVASYSLYLWHPPIVEALSDGSERFPLLLAVAAPLCLAAAFASYLLVESPFLRLRRRWARSSPPIVQPAAAGSALAPAGPGSG